MALSQNGTLNNSAQAVNMSAIINNLGINFSAWRNLPMNTIEDIRIWLSNYQVYQNALINYLNQFPNSTAAQNLMNNLYQVDPKFLSANITF